jgi:D-alanyl-D-alanine carboxypeptidase (penicillin-binding protein 5/6)
MRLRARRLVVPGAAVALACLAAAPLPAAAGSNPAAAAVTVGGPLLASHGTVVQYVGRPARKVPAVPASAWVVANASTGQVLAAKDPHGRFGPASTMKVLTAITLIPLLKPGSMVLASKAAADTEPMDAGLVAGRRYRVSDLFTALLTISANDAAVALTQATGSLAKGMALINAEAHHLQAYDVVAKRPNGLPADGQVESAYDEALIARQALAMPAFMKYDSTLSARFEVKPRHWETLVNQNWLLTKYRGALGGKIGWTVASEATYVGLARRNGVTLIVTILHCTPLQEITSAVKLLNWGFAMNDKVSPVGTLVPPLAAPAARHSTGKHGGQAGNAVSLAKAPAADSGSGGQLALYASVIAVTGLGLGGAGTLARRRRLAGKHRSSLDRDGSDPAADNQSGQPGAANGLADPDHLAGSAKPPLTLLPYSSVAAVSVLTSRAEPDRTSGRPRPSRRIDRFSPQAVAGTSVVGSSSTTAGPAAATGSVTAGSSATGSAITASRAGTSRAATTVNRPIAMPARNAMRTPSPVKKPICSTTIRVGPPVGVPADGRLVHRAATRPPTANQAPPAAASQEPSTATSRCRLPSTTRPPSSTAAPGSTSSHSRPEV